MKVSGNGGVGARMPSIPVRQQQRKLSAVTAKDHRLLVWDMYDVVGGSGSVPADQLDGGQT